MMKKKGSLISILTAVLIVIILMMAGNGRITGDRSGETAGKEPQSAQTSEAASSSEAASLPQETEVPAETPAPQETEAPEAAEEIPVPQETKTPEETLAPQETPVPEETPAAPEEDEDFIEYGTEVSDKDGVALYIHLYGELPPNFITKQEAESLGWSASRGNLGKIAPGKSIGGDRFGNYEGQLPKKKGRKYYECDIGYDGGYRGPERIIYSSDGLIFYTSDHYETFEQLY